MARISEYPVVTTLTGNELVPMDMGVPNAPVTVTATVTTLVQGLKPGNNNFGYLNIPLNPQSGNYTVLPSDQGGGILHPNGAGAGHTYSIPSNHAISYPLGTLFTFVNRDSNNLSIQVLTDTMYLAASTTTGTRTLAQNGLATAVKVENTVWIIWGAGLT